MMGWWLAVTACTALGLALWWGSQRTLAPDPTSKSSSPAAPNHEHVPTDWLGPIKLRHTAGDFHAALKLALETHDKMPAEDRLWVNEQLPVLHTSAGWLDVQTKRCDAATINFKAALAAREMPLARKGLGVCAVRRKDWDEASRELSAYRRAYPEDIRALHLLAESYEALEQYDEAVNSLEQALASPELTTPADKLDLQKRLKSLRARANAAGNLLTSRSEHFTLAFPSATEDLVVSDILMTLEGTLDMLVTRWGFSPPPAPVEVLIFPKSNFKDTLDNAPNWAEGLFDGRIRVPMMPQVQVLPERLKRILRHELTHALMAPHGGRIPVWFQEGVAQFFECDGYCLNDARSPALRGFSSKDVFSAPFLKLTKIEAQKAYKNALFFVQSLYYDTDATGRKTLEKILLHVNQNHAAIHGNDELLRPTNQNFDYWYAKVKSKWDT